MNTRRKWLCACLVSLLAVAVPAWPQEKEVPAFQRLKSLVGQWEMTAEDGGTMRVTYRLVSNGSVLAESISGQGHEDGMVTMYHLDGDSILATHYCSSGNQPRLRASAGPGQTDEITFRLVDVTNRKPGQHGQIHGLVVRFKDADRFTQEWTGEEGGKMSTMVFHWTRRK